MRSSRGMGAMRSSKMPKAKTITRKDNPDKVTVYAKGGETDKADVKQDKALIRKAVHKHERTLHPGKPLTKLRRGGMASCKWIQKAIKKPGALRSALGAKKGEPIPAGKLAKAAMAPGKLGQRARFAQVLRGMSKKK
jgi:hypothetical protein